MKSTYKMILATEELQHQFDTKLPKSTKECLTYARNLLEFCSYQALHQLSTSPNFLSGKDFRQLTYDMMLAWEAPSVESETLDKVRQLIVVFH